LWMMKKTEKSPLETPTSTPRRLFEKKSKKDPALEERSERRKGLQKRKNVKFAGPRNSLLKKKERLDNRPHLRQKKPCCEESFQNT